MPPHLISKPLTRSHYLLFTLSIEMGSIFSPLCLQTVLAKVLVI